MVARCDEGEEGCFLVGFGLWYDGYDERARVISMVRSDFGTTVEDRGEVTH